MKTAEEFLTEYKWKKFDEDCCHIEVYDKDGYNIKYYFRDIYLDGYYGIYDKHEKYIVFITSALNNHINVLTVLNKSLEIL